MWGGGTGLRTRCVAEEERRVRANAREYNEKFQYAVSGGAPAAPPRGAGVRASRWMGAGGWGKKLAFGPEETVLTGR